MLRPLALAFVLAATLCAPLSAKESLGVYSNWAAFRDDAPARCYAIAKPRGDADNAADASPPFASVATWPAANIRGQLHIRLSRKVREGGEVRLSVGRERFTLVANGRNGWAADARMDAAVVAAMRSASAMIVSSSDEAGRRFSDRYDLGGAASAMDAASVGCSAR